MCSPVDVRHGFRNLRKVLPDDALVEASLPLPCLTQLPLQVTRFCSNDEIESAKNKLNFTA